VRARLVRAAELAALLIVLGIVRLFGRRLLIPQRKATPMDQAPSAIPANIASILRVVGSFIGGYLLSKGYLTGEQLAQIGGVALPVVAILWSLIKNHNTTKTIQKAIDAPTGSAGK
jgi:hypothetical protein